MPIVTNTDFDVLPYQIPNLLAKINLFNAFRDKMEKEALQTVLGYKLYKDFIAGLAIDPIDPKWSKLKDGADYLDELSNLNEYKGMKSFLVPYIYSNWVRAKFDNLSEVGVNVAVSENVDQISPATRISNAFNDFVQQVGGKQLYRGSIKSFVVAEQHSFVGFMTANLTDYEGWVFTCPVKENIFDL